MSKLLTGYLVLLSACLAQTAPDTATLYATQAAGMSLTASAEQRRAMHKATDALIDSAVQQQNYMLAATLAVLQHSNYRNLDRDYQGALAASRQALDFQVKAGAKVNFDVLWDDLGADLLSVEDPAAAREAFLKSMAIGDPATTVRGGSAWRHLVQSEIALGRLPIARAEAGRFLTAAGTRATPFLASALLAQADVLMEDHLYDAAIDRLAQSKAAGAEWYDILNSLLTCNLVALRSLDYDHALALSKRIDAEFTDLPVSTVSFTKATILARRRMAGDLDGVFREQAADLAAARDSRSVMGQVQALSALSSTYRSAHSIPSQIAALEEALTLQKTHSDLPSAQLYVRTLNALGDAYLALPQPRISAARRSFRTALSFIESLDQASWRVSLGASYADAILGQAEVDLLDDDAAHARETLQLALDSKPAGAVFEPADVLWALAKLERAENNYPAMSQRYEQTVAALALSGRDSFEALCRAEFSLALLTKPKPSPHELTTIEVQLRAASALAARLDLSDLQWRLRYQQGILSEALLDDSAAFASYQAAISQLENQRAALSQPDQRQSLASQAAAQDLYRRALSIAARRNDAPGVWELLEKSKARVFLDGMAGRRFQNDAAVSPAVAQVLTLQNRLGALAVESRPETAAILRGAGHAVSVAERQTLEAQLNIAREEDSLIRTREGNTLAAHPVSIAQVRALLPANTALIEYGVLADAVVSVTVSRDAVRLVRTLAGIHALQTQAHSLRALMTSGAPDQDVAAAMQSLSQQVVQPALVDLPGDVDRLIIVPAGFLHYLPYHALPTADGRALIDRFTISYLPSASVLAFLKEGPAHPEKVFVGALGNLAIDGKVPLPGTLTEAEAIGALYPGSQHAFEAEFTHNRARDALLQADLVHFATHGELSEAAPLFSSIVTANSAGEAARLPVYELSGFRIHARTVILSACETGLGSISGGDEVSGLTRAILLSGASTVVSSLWQVSDASTALLMREFHAGLTAGQPADTALRNAALAVRKQYPQPFYWAPFIVTGATH
jgi:CHAT domain-containing protein